MGADPGRSRWRTPRTLRTCAFGAAGLLLAGCASMPDHGEIRPVEASQGVDSQVRVFGVPPADRASPQEIVDGFLEAMTSDDPQLQTARKYLTEEAANNWKPGAAVTVLSSGLDRFSVQGEKDPMAPRFKVAGKMLATVDERSAYQPETGDRRYEEFLQLTQDKNKQWRIATPPSSLVLSESDFQRIYMPVNKYYFAGGTLVADPVYVRQRNDPDSRMDPTTQTVTSLLAGPSKWLGPVVTSSFPTGTQLSEGTKSLSYDGQNTLRVPLNSKANDVAQPQCQRMATQLLYTVKDLTGSRVDRVELIHSDGKSSLCGVSEAAAAVIANRPLSPGHQYYVDEEDRLQRLSLDPNREEQQDPPTPVPGPLSGNPAFKVGSAAIAYDEKRAAVVSEDGHGLYVVNLTTAGQMPQPVLTGKGAKPNGLTTPTWDAAGDLWVADPDPQNAALRRLPGGTGTPERVEVSGLDGGRITGLKASPDGVRMALLVQRESRNYLYIGRIERPDAKGDVSAVSVRELRPAAPQLADVTALSWAPRGRLLVVGRESGGIVQARYMLADGSMVGAGLPGAAGLVAVTASEDEKKPVVASSLEDGIVWLPPGAQWRTVVAGGRAPIYPG
ncbi:LpqB family beta-propeller domain-containing protein [Streptomyces sp. H34-S4]|uniref:LpqB family beta-propeller domain-containing protein n=1 Tax=Streptomyces sp. H34-S4 TaxID=2996463 RepID=UPI0022715B30|nr:LpqB family beta-propeller domain-containing protein [Streptomyces sp. H34-S4]MCY0939103.1 LpqB family beta-propeller domain-containing protein [Streptomyces sp. H34-S4]